MKKLILSAVLLAAITTAASAQKYFTKTGNVSFFSKAPLENIEAHTHQAIALLDQQTGSVAFKILIRSFEFEKALMQDHFNENYMESEKYPESTFDGKITNITAIDFSKNGTYDAAVKGKLTIHGVTKEVELPGKITVETGKVTTNCTFKVKLADYNIKNDKGGKLADEIEIKVNTTLTPKK